MAMTLTQDDIDAIAIAVWSQQLPLTFDCALSIGGSDGTLFALDGTWTADCIMFKTEGT